MIGRWEWDSPFSQNLLILLQGGPRRQPRLRPSTLPTPRHNAPFESTLAWRWEWDSNPRSSCELTRFPSARTRPTMRSHQTKFFIPDLQVYFQIMKDGRPPRERKAGREVLSGISPIGMSHGCACSCGRRSCRSSCHGRGSDRRTCCHHHPRSCRQPTCHMRLRGPVPCFVPYFRLPCV